MRESSVQQDFDIAIVGGGMVGASLACALGNCGLQIGVLDRAPFDPEWETSAGKFDFRVSAISPSSQNFLRHIGAWNEITPQRISPYLEMNVWDGEGTGVVHFDAADVNADELGFIIENREILRSLYRRMADFSNIRVLTPYTVESFKTTPQGPITLTTVEGETLSIDLLIGADGPGSPVRKLAGFRTREWDYQHQAIVTTVRTELPHQQTARQRFMDSGPLAFLPLSSEHSTESVSGSGAQHYCSIVWSVLPQRAEQLQALDDGAFAAELARCFEYRLGQIEWVDQRFAVPLRQRHSIDYVQDRIALIGDAAHTIHPLAGQGVNLGFQDSRALAGVINESLAQGTGVACYPALRRYQRQRKGANLGMMWVMEGFKQLFAPQPLPVMWLRNAGMRGVNNFSPLKNQLIRRAMGLEATGI